MQTTEYSPGRSVDVFDEGSAETVLLWHGMQTDARAAVRPLAELVSRRGVNVVVPDWDSHADDRGRGDLLGSAEFARGRFPDGPLVLVGWSLGGAAAAGLTLAAPTHGITIARTICLGGAFTASDPLSGRALTPPQAQDHGAFLLLHGVGDDVIPVGVSHTFGGQLRRTGWPVEVVDLDTDHAAIARARYDSDGDRYVPAADAQTLLVAEDVAARIRASFQNP